jgi:ubiquinone/menaquinone biosynthesis C-methylase UbiE
VSQKNEWTHADSKVEVKGFEARHYDLLMNAITGGTYPLFIRRAVREMRVQPGDEILVLGSGTGRNLCLMNKYLSGQGRIVGLDIGPEMLEQSKQRCQHLSHIAIENQRIEQPLPYQEEFDKVFISFVLHGLVPDERLKVIANAYQALRPGGEFIILDYNEFDLKHALLPVRFAFKIECPLASEFVGVDLQARLQEQGFDDFRVHPHYFGYVRLISARKPAQ